MKVLGICAGNGVNLHPFEVSNKFTVVGNVEPRSTYYVGKENAQWAVNFQNSRMVRSLAEYSGPKPDIIIGNPDCGHSSILRLSVAKVVGKPKDNPSLNLYAEAIAKFKPKLFFMENLPKLLELITKDEFRIMFKGYKLKFITRSVACFGNSQISRVRLVIVGVREDLSEHLSIFKVSKTYDRASLKTTRELLKGLAKENPDNCNMREPDTELVTMYSKFKISAGEATKVWNTELLGKTRWEVKGRNFTTAPGVYRNLADGYPCTARKANRQYGPSGKMLTPRELARIQGIPDSFILLYQDSKSKYYINKGRLTATKTPPYEIGLWYLRKTLKLKKLGYELPSGKR